VQTSRTFVFWACPSVNCGAGCPLYLLLRSASQMDAAPILHAALIFKNKLSSSYQNQIVNALKLFFSSILNKKIEVEKIHRPKREKKLPNVLSKEEVKMILNAHSNLKHKIMLSLIYSCGLRCGELLALQPVHIDSKRNIVLVKNAKGKKHRIAPLSPKILEMLRKYYS
jgi:integrase/recombinase XerD